MPVIIISYRNDLIPDKYLHRTLKIRLNYNHQQIINNKLLNFSLLSFVKMCYRQGLPYLRVTDSNVKNNNIRDSLLPVKF